MIKRTNIAMHELLGLKAEVKCSASGAFDGMLGTVVEETKNTLTLATAGGEKQVPKKGTRFEFTAHGKKMLVDGGDIAFRPFERPKKNSKKASKR